MVLAVAHPNPWLVVCLFLSPFAVPRRFSLQPSCPPRGRPTLVVLPPVASSSVARGGKGKKRILQQNSLAQHWARDWRALKEKKEQTTQGRDGRTADAATTQGF